MVIELHVDDGYASAPPASIVKAMTYLMGVLTITVSQLMGPNTMMEHVGTLHWHLAADASKRSNFATNNSIHQSYQRCVTVHGTWGVLVSGSVCTRKVGSSLVNRWMALDMLT